jgi:omega-6 fatty acid desaturase (delta-12 desaturase)
MVVRMTERANSEASRLTTIGWHKALGAYRRPSHFRSSLELAVTAVPFLLLWASALASLALGHWWGVLLTFPAAAFLVRLFMIQHDCGHGSFFRRRPINDWIGRIIGVLTLTPYDYWRRTHAAHHAGAGNLDQRGMGDLVTLTVAEYRQLPKWRRLGYRLYRNPIFLFGLGPGITFLLKHRLPMGLMRNGARPWISAMATNAAIAVGAAAVILVVGIGPFLLVQLPITLIAGTVGVWLFYVQHQFEDTYWEEGRDWQFEDGALQGSSHYDLPAVLRWFTANVGIHHVHHLASRVPFYRLARILSDFPELREQGRITLLQSFRTVRLALWDHRRRRLISFREAARSA